MNDDVIEITDEELIAARDRACAEQGLTWEELLSCVDDCGCHFTGLPSTASVAHCEMILMLCKWIP